MQRFIACLLLLMATLCAAQQTTARDSAPQGVDTALVRILMQPYFHKLQSHYLTADTIFSQRKPYVAPSSHRSNSAGLLAESGLEHSGSLMRGINVSTSSNASLSSALELQLSGKLSRDVSISAVISDQSLPATAEGTTASLQEFDKMFIRIFSERTSLLAGDVEVKQTAGMFDRYSRQAMGASFATQQKTGSARYTVSAAAGVSKGKFARLQLAVMDGNQGAYRLTGADGEFYIVVLSGSERVYADGQLLERGADADYTISYATAEITFMPRFLVTQNKRIVVEYEYSERSYARYIVSAGNALRTERGGAYVNIFYEGDAKNQPLDESISDTDKLQMAMAGAQYWRAVAATADSTHPLRQLVTPKQKMLLTAGGFFCFDTLGRIAVDAALSNNSTNLYASPSVARTGFAMNLSAEKAWLVGRKNKITAGASALMFDRKFETPERFVSAEFERDRNIDGTLLGRRFGEYAGRFGYRYADKLHFDASLAAVSAGATDAALSPLDTSYAAMRGMRMVADFGVHHRGLASAIGGSMTSTRQAGGSAVFARAKGEVSQRIAKVQVGVRGEMESNRKLDAQRALSLGSAAFHSEEVFARSDSMRRFGAEIFARNRNDFLPYAGSMKSFSRAQDVGASGEFRGANIRNKLTATYRHIAYSDSAARDNVLLGRNEFSGRFAGGFLTTNAAYELGAGLEPKQNFIYIDVGTGQGVYAWHDYNGDGKQDLTEFEVAAFRDEAQYIRVALPSREYVQAYAGKFSLYLNLMPAMLIKQRRGFAGFVSRLTNTFSYSNAHKNLRSSFAANANPFFAEPLSDTAVLHQNYTAVNTLSYLSHSAKTKVDATWRGNSAKNMLVNGYEIRQGSAVGINVNRRFGAVFQLNVGALHEQRVYRTQHDLAGTAYDVAASSATVAGELHPLMALRLCASYKFSGKHNRLGSEAAQLHDAKLEATCNFPRKGMVSGSASLVGATFDGNANSAVGYEMLQGYGAGRNFTWSVALRRILGGSIELNLLYTGRKLPAGRVVHSGSVEVRMAL